MSARFHIRAEMISNFLTHRAQLVSSSYGMLFNLLILKDFNWRVSFLLSWFGWSNCQRDFGEDN